MYAAILISVWAVRSEYSWGEQGNMGDESYGVCSFTPAKTGSDLLIDAL